MKHKTKKNAAGTVISKIFLVLIFIGGIGLLLYPTIANYWNSTHQSRTIGGYIDSVEKMESFNFDPLKQEAEEYNRKLSRNPNRFFPTEEESKEYFNTLKIPGTDVLGYISIPKIEVTLPIYHGTDNAILQVAVGHMEGTSLPVGGQGTHAVLSGHTGLPSSKLFTNLEKMEIGDQFTIHIMDEALVYEVDQVLTVLPNETDALEIDPQSDFVTLITCTPYGVNSHRLLVRGVRVPGPVTEESESTSTQTPQVHKEQLHVEFPWIPVFLAGAGIVVFIFFLLKPKKKEKS